MILQAFLRRDVLRGSVAFLPYDPLTGRPIEVPCAVTALVGASTPATTAVQHSGGLHGFLRLPAGGYRFLLRPAPGSAFLPSLRTLALPLPEGAANVILAPLRPGPAYTPLAGMVTLRGTLHFRRAALTPARWAAVFARLEEPRNGGWQSVSTAWTRSDGNGEFALFLPPRPPGAEGQRLKLRAVVTVHASAPSDPTRDADDLSDLVSDDGDEDDLRQRQPQVAGPIVYDHEDLRAGATLSLNSDQYTTIPPGATQPQRQRVILLG